MDNNKNVWNRIWTKLYYISNTFYWVFVDAISGSVAYFMNMCGHEKIIKNVMFIILFMAIALNLSLIPTFGIIGAAIATAIVKVFWNITLTVIIHKKYNAYFLYFPILLNKWE